MGTTRSRHILKRRDFSVLSETFQKVWGVSHFLCLLYDKWVSYDGYMCGISIYRLVMDIASTYLVEVTINWYFTDIDLVTHDIVCAMTSRLDGLTYCAVRLTRLFGPAFSSDNAGDGPMLTRPRLIQCPYCPTTFASFGALAEHIRSNHSSGVDYRIVCAQYPQIRLCERCNKVVGSGSALHNHQRTDCSVRPAANENRNLVETPETLLSATARPAIAIPSANPDHIALDTPVAVADDVAAQPVVTEALDALPVDAPDRVRPYRPVRSVPPSLLPMCQTVLERVLITLRDASETNLGIQAIHVAALLALPRFLQSVTGASNIRKTKRVLGSILDSVDLLGSLTATAAVALPDPDSMRRDAHQGGLPTKRLKQLVRAGCLSRAVRLIESASSHVGVALPTDQDLTGELERLFPARTAADDLPVGVITDIHENLDDDRDAIRGSLRLSPEDINNTLDRLPAQSAASFSGWTYELIKQLALGQTAENIRMRALIQAVATLYLAGKGGPVGCWTEDRLVPLRKQTGSIRPIVIGEVWPRVFSRMAASKLSPRLVDTLLPLQWGIGSQGGPEVVAHAGHLFSTLVSQAPGKAMQLVDFTNAFNTIRRRPIFEALEKYLPCLLPWFRWMYGGSSMLRLADGSPAVSCGTGVRQGDPLACLLFCLGLHDVLREAQRLHPELTILADLDDVTVLGDATAMPAFLDTLQRLSNPLGLSVHPEKSVAWTRRDSNHAATMAVTYDGHRLMGTYVGTHEYQCTSITAALADHQQVVSLIATLEPAMALPLLQSCINTRPVYLARTTPPHLTDQALHSFDNMVDVAILRIAGSSAGALPAVSQLLRAIPQADGGLGFPRLHDIRVAAWVASFCHATDALAEHLPHLLSLIDRSNSAAIDHHMTIVKQLVPTLFRSNGQQGVAGDEDTAVNTLRPHFWPTPEMVQPVLGLAQDYGLPLLGDRSRRFTPTSLPKQRDLCIRDMEQKIQQVGDLLNQDPLGRSWWLSQSFKGSGAWLSGGQSNVSLLELTDDEFRSSLTLRLLLPCCWAPPGAYTRCTACADTLYGDQTQDSRLHALTCIRSQGKRTLRHDHLRDVLATTLKRLYGAHAVQLETVLGQGLRRPDIVLTVQGQVTLIDVAVATPCSAQYLSRQSDRVALAAATVFEAKKRRAYVATLQALQLQQDALVPFVLEATGRLGQAATSFLERVEADPHVRQEVDGKASIKFLIALLRCSLHRGNAMAVEFHRRQSRLIGRVEWNGMGMDAIDEEREAQLFLDEAVMANTPII